MVGGAPRAQLNPIISNTVVMPMNSGASQTPVGGALPLTFLFGPSGLFYPSIIGGVGMLLLEVFVSVRGATTLGLGRSLLFLCWLVFIPWGCIAATGRSHRAVDGFRRYALRPYRPVSAIGLWFSLLRTHRD